MIDAKWFSTEEHKALCELKLHTETGKRIPQKHYIYTKRKSVCINWGRFCLDHFRMRLSDGRVECKIIIKGNCSIQWWIKSYKNSNDIVASRQLTEGQWSSERHNFDDSD